MIETPTKTSFLDSLPRLSKDSKLSFQCDPSVPCFNRCCGDLNLALSPYDVLRLRFHLNIDSKTFIGKYATVSTLQGNHFPALSLRMTDNREKSCPFVTDAGCSVYRHRPGACRVYPLGRGASIDEQGDIHEEYVLVREPHCLGFATSEQLSVSTYLEQQGMEPYVEFDNLYIQLMQHWNQHGHPLPKPLFGKVFIAVYRPDNLHLIHSDDRAPLSSSTSSPTLKDAEDVLKHAIQWLETQIF